MAMLRSVILALLALDPPVPADYQVCAKVHNGPIERPDHYATNPYQRKADLA